MARNSSSTRGTPPTALDFDLEDENGIVETVSIPKGSAVDATARAAAATAQEDIDDHEANHPAAAGRDYTPSDDTPEATGDADAGVGTDAHTGMTTSTTVPNANHQGRRAGRDFRVPSGVERRPGLAG